MVVFDRGADRMSVMGRVAAALRPKRASEPAPDLPLGQILQDDCVAAMARAARRLRST